MSICPEISANHSLFETSNSRVIERKRELSARLNCDSIAAKIVRGILSKSSKTIEQAIAEGAQRILARAGNSRSLNADSLLTRIRATVEKYLLKHEPEATTEAIAGFIDTLHADDLCLAIACQRGDQAAWSDLVE